MDAYEKFLRLVDFSEDELPSQLPLWRNACKMLGLTKEDVRFAADEWIPTYWDISLHGVRKCIGAYIRELIEMTRLREYKERGDIILYGNIPCHPVCFYANKISGGNSLHTAHPDFLLPTTLSTFFNKNIFELNDEGSCMNPLCGHCGKNRMRADAQYKGLIVSPHVMWNWGLYCDEAPKTEELLQGLGDDDWHCVLTTMSKDVSLGTHESEDQERIDFLASQIRLAQQQVSVYTGYVVTDEHILMAADYYMDYLNKLEELESLVLYSDPQPISGNDLAIFGAMVRASFDTGFLYLNEAIDTMIEEVKGLVKQGKGPLPKGAPRLACHFLPYTFPWISNEFINNGINLSTSVLFATASMLKRCTDTDVYKLMAKQWLSNPSAVNMMDEANIVSEMLMDCPADGVMYGFYSFDRWMGALHKLTIQVIEEKTGIPHYYMEGDFWNDARTPQKDRVARIEAIAYKVKINRMVNGWNNG